jgi:hypothetical protein
MALLYGSLQLTAHFKRVCRIALERLGVESLKLFRRQIPDLVGEGGHESEFLGSGVREER